MTDTSMSDVLGRPVEILLVEDSPGDIRLTQEALRDAKVKNNLHVARDGVEAMAYLRQEGENVDMPRPDLVLLDLNLPKKSGHEVLEEVKMDAGLKSIPVVILTVSEADEDIIKAYSQHANSFISKPVDLEQFIKVVNSIDEFWFTIVKLPSSG